MEQVIAIRPVWYNIIPRYTKDSLDFNYIRLRGKIVIITRSDNKNRI
jgi:hypothetical protein